MIPAISGYTENRNAITSTTRPAARRRVSRIRAQNTKLSTVARVGAMYCQPYSWISMPCTAKYAHVPITASSSRTSYHGTPRRCRAADPGARLRMGVTMNTIGTNTAISRYRNELVGMVTPPTFQKNTWFMVSSTPTTVSTITRLRQNGVSRGLASCRETSEGMVGWAASSPPCGCVAVISAPVRGSMAGPGAVTGPVVPAGPEALAVPAASPDWYGVLMRGLRRVRWWTRRRAGCRGCPGARGGWLSSSPPTPCART